MNDYSLTIDENLNSIDSLLNDAPAGKLSFLDSLEGTLTELMERGVFGGISNTQGIEFNVDKATNDSYIQSRNYSQYTTGWKNSSDGTLEGKTLNIGKTGNLRLKVEEDSINLYKSDGTLIGKITNDNSTHALILTAGESAGLLILKTDTDKTSIAPYGTSVLGSSGHSWSEIFTDYVNLNQAAGASISTLDKHFVIKLGGTQYKVPCEAA